jgi:hypothetical protein
MRPLDFFETVVVALPNALGAADEPRYLSPTLPPLAIKAASLDGKELRRLAIIRARPVLLVEELLV